jgi:hypothetical protein
MLIGIYKSEDLGGYFVIDPQPTLRAYVHDAELFKDHAGAGLL